MEGRRISPEVHNIIQIRSSHPGYYYYAQKGLQKPHICWEIRRVESGREDVEERRGRTSVLPIIIIIIFYQTWRTNAEYKLNHIPMYIHIPKRHFSNVEEEWKLKLWLKERKSLLTFSCSYTGKCSALASDVLMISNSIFIRSPSSIQKTAEHFLHNPLHRNKFSPFVFSGTFHWGCSLVSLHLHRAQWPLIGLTLVY